MDSIKILIADSSPVYRKMFLSAINAADKTVTVSLTADAAEAIDTIMRKTPDIVIIDAELPGKNLLDIFKLITAEIPKAFVLVTARPSSASAGILIEALSAGASDSMTKPIYESYKENLETITNKMIEIIEIQRAGIKSENSGTENTGSKIIGGKSKSIKQSTVNTKFKKLSSSKPFRPQIILIAVSTGGPGALETIISALRPDIPVPILIVQHMPPHFIEILAKRLDSKSMLKVKVAENGEKIRGGTVYLAPGGVHMRLSSDNEVYLDDSPPINGVRPAADTLFESVAEDFAGLMVLAIVLTGMGQDSMKGIIKLKEKKICFCIAQSEKTCVVYGMPRAVVEKSLADKISDLDQIAAEIEGFDYI